MALPEALGPIIARTLFWLMKVFAGYRGCGFGLVFVILHNQFEGKLLVGHLETAGSGSPGPPGVPWPFGTNPTVGLLPVSSALTPMRISFGLLGAAAPG